MLEIYAALCYLNEKKALHVVFQAHLVGTENKVESS